MTCGDEALEAFVVGEEVADGSVTAGGSAIDATPSHPASSSNLAPSNFLFDKLSPTGFFVSKHDSLLGKRLRKCGAVDSAAIVL